MTNLAALAAGAGTTISIVVLLALLRRPIRLLRLLAFPIVIAAAAAGVGVYRLFAPEVPAVAEALFFWLLAFLLATAALRVLGLYFFEIHLQERKGLRLPPLLVRVSFIAGYLIAGLVIVRIALPDLNVTPLIATSAVTSLVLGLALQPILGNFFSGLVLTLERPFRINDWIRVAEVDGRVVDITWRTTHLRTRDNDTLVLPNGVIAAQEILNYSQPHPLHLERIYVGVHYRTPPYRVEKALLDAARRVENVLERPSPTVYLHAFDDSAITYELRCWTEDLARLPFVAAEVRREIWEEFQRQDITIPFPIRTLEIEPRVNTVEVASREEPAAPEAWACLWVAEGPDQGRSTLLGDRMTVGRSADCDLFLSAPDVSKEHLRIEKADAGWLLTDLDSSWGTQVGGESVTTHRLQNLDRIRIGDTVLIFEENLG